MNKNLLVVLSLILLLSFLLFNKQVLIFNGVIIGLYFIPIDPKFILERKIKEVNYKLNFTTIANIENLHLYQIIEESYFNLLYSFYELGFIAYIDNSENKRSY